MTRALERLAAWESVDGTRRSYKQLIVTVFPPMWAVTLEDGVGRRVYACESDPPACGVLKRVETVPDNVGLASTIHKALDMWEVRP